MGRLGSHAVYASPGQSPARTQDSLPAAGQALPGGLNGPLGSSGRFRVVPTSLLLPQASPGASARRSDKTEVNSVDHTEARNSYLATPTRTAKPRALDSASRLSEPGGHLKPCGLS